MIAKTYAVLTDIGKSRSNFLSFHYVKIVGRRVDCDTLLSILLRLLVIRNGSQCLNDWRLLLG
jgi:hypothetical protein